MGSFEQLQIAEPRLPARDDRCRGWMVIGMRGLIETCQQALRSGDLPALSSHRHTGVRVQGSAPRPFLEAFSGQQRNQVLRRIDACSSLCSTSLGFVEKAQVLALEGACPVPTGSAVPCLLALPHYSGGQRAKLVSIQTEPSCS